MTKKIRVERYVYKPDDIVITRGASVVEEKPPKDQPKATKAKQPDRAAEEALRKQIARLLQEQRDRIAADIEAGRPVDWAAVERELGAKLTPALAKIATDQAIALAVEAGLGFDIAKVNLAAWKWASEYSYELVKGITATTREIVANATAQFIATPGMTVGELASQLLETGFGPVRAQMIAVTETTRAYSQATSIMQAMLAEMGVKVEQVWQTSSDEKTCTEICEPLDGLPQDEWGDYADGPPAHVNCILPGQIAAVPGLFAGAKSLYHGRVIEITTQSGHVLTVTENHPILTPQGWIAAKFISEGQYVFTHGAVEGMASSVHPNYQHRPSVIEQVFSSLGMAQGMTTVSVPLSPIDLHGDGRTVQGNIEIVGPDWKLLPNYNPILAQPSSKPGLVLGDAILTNVFREGMLAFLSKGASATSDSSVSISSEGGAFVWSESGHTQEIGLAYAPTLDASRIENAIDCPTVDTVKAGEFLRRYTSDIRRDKVVSVLSREFDGHVYDLQSLTYELYTVNGIIVKNCRCWTTTRMLK